MIGIKYGGFNNRGRKMWSGKLKIRKLQDQVEYQQKLFLRNLDIRSLSKFFNKVLEEKNYPVE